MQSQDEAADEAWSESACLLVDAVIKDAALSLSQEQYLSLNELFQSFTIINASRWVILYSLVITLQGLVSFKHCKDQSGCVKLKFKT